MKEASAVTGRFDLTDAQWAALKPLLPVPPRSGPAVIVEQNGS
jgi:hypothetical protein